MVAFFGTFSLIWSWPIPTHKPEEVEAMKRANFITDCIYFQCGITHLEESAMNPLPHE